jgi:hypothetical protein
LKHPSTDGSNAPHSLQWDESNLQTNEDNKDAKVRLATLAVVPSYTSDSR